MHSFVGTVRDLSIKGLGVVDSPEGKVYFVDGAIPGDEGEFVPNKVEKRYGFATLKKLITPSSQRQSPPCPHQGYSDSACRGCPWMILPYDEQVVRKEQFLTYHLQRNKLLHEQTKRLPFQRAPSELNYRNRAQFKTDGQKLGFVSTGDGKNIIDIKDCLILTEGTRKQLTSLRSQLPNKEWMPKPTYDWNFFEVDDLTPIENISINKKLAFRQGNSKQNEFMREWLKTTASELGPEYEWLELFCGSGNFTEVLADSKHVRRITAIEASEQAVAALQNKALKGVHAHAADLFKSSSLQRVKNLCPKPDVLLLDPPRAGFKNLHLLTETMSTLKAIIYISCDISTFAYDAQKLTLQGWRLATIQGVDQFPHTPHVELVSLFLK